MEAENIQPKSQELLRDEMQPRFVMNKGAAEEYVGLLRSFPLSKQICICGHSVKSHGFSTITGYYCKTGNIDCRCRYPEPVYCASDARFFKRSTHGFGRKHALGLGIAALESKGGSGQWMVQLSCTVRDCEEIELTVVCLDDKNRVLNRSTKNSVFLCHKHTMELGGNLL